MTRRPVAEGIFTWPSENPQLIGGRCENCRTVSFPTVPSCSRCHSGDVSVYLLPRHGHLWSFTVQGFPPKSPPYFRQEPPESFRPYGVGYVEFPGELRVEARLTENDPERLHIGMEMELVIVPLGADDTETELLSYAFEPSSGS